MTSIFKPLLIASLLAVAGISVQAHGMGGPQSGPMSQHQRMDPAKRQEVVATHQADLKAKLKLSPAQEGAWNAFTASMQPPANMGMRMSSESRQARHDEMSKLSTPERMGRMNAFKAQRDAEMAKRQDATKTFYAALTPDQQKVFDANAMGRGGRGGHGMHGMQRG